MSVPLIESQIDAFAARPVPARLPWLQTLRQQALDIVREKGLPTRLDESWRYTDLKAYGQKKYVIGRNTETFGRWSEKLKLFLRFEGPRLVFVNGVFQPELCVGLDERTIQLVPLSALLQEPEHTLWPLVRSAYAERFKQEPLALLNKAMASDGLVMRIPDGLECKAPIHAAFVSTNAEDHAIWHTKNFIFCGAGSKSTLIEHYFDLEDNAQLANVATSISLATDARCAHYRVQEKSTQSQIFQHTAVAAEQRAHYAHHAFGTGAALDRHAIAIELNGEQAQADVQGLLMPGQRQQHDVHLSISHLAPRTDSKTAWRNLAQGRARNAFQGEIIVAASAPGAAAALLNKNLLLSSEAEIDAKPVLEIHTDDVQASHGATTGQIDEQALFYLQARGIPKAQARRIMIEAFCRAGWPPGALASIDEYVHDSLDFLVANLTDE